MSSPIRRAAHPYTEWEDYQAGMYGASPTPELHTDLATALLTTPADLEIAMRAACFAWPVATEHHLTNAEENRRAWLGAAACWWAGRCPEHTTRIAWWRLPRNAHRPANLAAERVIRWWEIERTGEYPLFVLTPTGAAGHA